MSKIVAGCCVKPTKECLTQHKDFANCNGKSFFHVREVAENQIYLTAWGKQSYDIGLFEFMESAINRKG